MQRYLLGELPDSEQAALEQEYFKDGRLFEQMVQVENELVDKYARGLLSPTTRDRFEKYYLAHPKRRERAKFAQALAAKVAEFNEVVAPPVRTESLLERLGALMRGPKLAWALSVAVLLIAVIAGWSLIKTRRLQQELASTEAEKITRQQRERELQQQVTIERERAETLFQELDRLRMGQNTTTPSPLTEPKGASTLATLVLAIGGTRGADTGQPPVLVIPTGTEQVRLQLSLRENDYSSYRAVMQSAGGNTIFTSRRLNTTNKRSGANLTLLIPARMFSAGDYVLTLRGISKTGEVEDISKSLFRVERK